MKSSIKDTNVCRTLSGATGTAAGTGSLCTIFLGPQGPHVLPLVDPVARAKNLDHVYTGIHAL